MRRGAHIAVLASLLAAACAPAPDNRDGEDAGGPRIASLNPCADAILAEIAPGHLVAVSHYSQDPASSSMDTDVARRFAATSGNAEEIARLDPDVVIAGTFLPPATERALAAMGYRVVKTGSIASVDDARQQVRELAAIADERDAGERLVTEIDESLIAAKPSGQEPVSALVWQSGGLVPGEATLVSDLLRNTGFTNFSAGRGLGQGAVVPLEDVLADPPQVILNAGSGRMQNHPALAALSGRTTDFDTRLTWCGGPTIIAAAARLAEIREGLPR
ncbi:ABC transporter substrate-binding protein [Croceicoccus sediminis]|uniref:ABC transporter substrate-binding protein n=1 Tax=Croceicoccus sediminis TaxID=2571150 RepID=UPI00118342A3|nr:helical backbone metal receptor [Croceicoccus sediminis]